MEAHDNRDRTRRIEVKQKFTDVVPGGTEYFRTRDSVVEDRVEYLYDAEGNLIATVGYKKGLGNQPESVTGQRPGCTIGPPIAERQCRHTRY